MNAKFTKEQCLEKIRKVYNKYGKVTAKLINKEGSPTTIVFDRIFGSTTSALLEANIPLTIGQRKNVSKEEINKEIFRIQKEFGYVSKPLFEKHSSYSPKIIQRIYGSFANMYDELKNNGITRHPSGRIPTDDELKQEFLRIYNKHGIISQSIISSESCYSTTCYKDRFGSINNLRELLGIDKVSAGQSTDADYVIGQIETILQEPAEKEKTFDWLINPDTNMHLFMDSYFPKHNIAVEYNGPQHYFIDDRYTTSEEALLYRQKLDQLKIDLMEAHNIPVYTIKYNDKKDVESLRNLLDTI